MRDRTRGGSTLTQDDVARFASAPVIVRGGDRVACRFRELTLLPTELRVNDRPVWSSAGALADAGKARCPQQRDIRELLPRLLALRGGRVRTLPPALEPAQKRQRAAAAPTTVHMGSAGYHLYYEGVARCCPPPFHTIMIIMTMS